VPLCGFHSDGFVNPSFAQVFGAWVGASGRGFASLASDEPVGRYPTIHHPETKPTTPTTKNPPKRAGRGSSLKASTFIEFICTSFAQSAARPYLRKYKGPRIPIVAHTLLCKNQIHRDMKPISKLLARLGHLKTSTFLTRMQWKVENLLLQERKSCKTMLHNYNTSI